jgi:hypothetical protein
MKRLAASLVFAAVILAPAVSFAQGSQPKPTTRVVPCDATCKHQHCTDMCAGRAKMVCNGASPENKSQCIQRNEGKCVKQCTR